MSGSNTRGTQPRAEAVTNAANLRAFDRLPKEVRRWVSQDAILQYSAVSIGRTYRHWRKANPGVRMQDFINKAAGVDIANAAMDSTDPRFIELKEEAAA